MCDYSQGKIYVIRAPGTDRIYIGSTVLPLEQRLRLHRQKGGASCRSRELIGIPGHTIELLEAYPCATVTELRRREGHHIRQHSGVAVNRNIAGRTQAEHYADNADRIRTKALNWYYANIERRKAYYEANKEKLLAYQRDYYHTKLKAQREAQRAAAFAAAVADGTAIDPDHPPAWAQRAAGTSPTTSAGGCETGEAPAAAAILNPTSVAAASPAGV
jgi:hypothetical protein